MRTNRLEFLTHCIDLGKGRIGDRCLFLQGFKVLLRLHDLTLERIVLLLRDLTVCKLLVGLLRRRL